jgi:glycosyltransferase involved in cell wall biosynthesis
MGYPPNEEGMRWFVKRVWPLVKREVEGAVFVAAGGFPRDSLKRLERRGDVHVTGYLPSIEPYVLHATVSVAPLQVAAGMQNKVALSMALGIPVVATPGAVSWLPPKARGWVAQAADAKGFARAVVDILKSPRNAKARVRKAAAFIRANYRWDKAGRMMDKVLRDAVRHHHEDTKALRNSF